MKGQPITRVEPMANGILRVTFDTGNSVIVDMKPVFGGFRFGVLQNPDVWRTADAFLIFCEKISYFLRNYFPKFIA